VRSSKTMIAAKVVAVVALFVGLTSFVVRGIFPSVSVPQVVIGVLLGNAAIFSIGVVVMLCSLHFRQWVLRRGGIDTQWLWFRSDPPGLDRMRGKDQA
jgi:hypothetical protein